MIDNDFSPALVEGAKLAARQRGHIPVTDEMVLAFIVASDSNGYGAEKGSFLWETTERGLRAAIAALR
jgi:hypothetical protein